VAEDAWWLKTTPADIARIYQEVFQHGNGPLVLEHLVGRFHDRPIWVAGALEGSRETERRAAQKEVVEFILRQLGTSVAVADEPAA
jgi:hypothetical protein